MNTRVTHNYTGLGWEGAKYGATKDLPTAEIAKRIKAEVADMFPSIKVSVRTKTYTGGCSINLTIVDFGFGPVTEQYTAYKQTNMDLRFSDWCNKNGVPPVEYTPDGVNIVERIERIANKYRYDDSDGQYDYFDTNFCFFVNF